MHKKNELENYMQLNLQDLYNFEGNNFKFIVIS
jgi:hypothetical protein